ncbi:MAG: amidohydrolase family protein, partial [Oscillospiraceae bacterium]
MRTLIKNGFVIDGSGSEGFFGSVVLDGERIAYVGESAPVCCERVIDAKGKVVCPGFIDTHSHSDLKLLQEPFQAPKICQGITTEVLGQDGISMAPLPQKYVAEWKKNLAGLDGESDSISWEYPDTESYLRSLESAGICTNAAYLIPHGNVRLEVMGLTDRKATREELDEMKRVVKREMEAGALGLSSGLIYIPCAYSDVEEISELCSVVAEYDGVFVVHQRSEAELILSSMDEILEVARRSGVRIHFSHFKACGKKTWALVPQMLEKLDK